MTSTTSPGSDSEMPSSAPVAASTAPEGGGRAARTPRKRTFSQTTDEPTNINNTMNSAAAAAAALAPGALPHANLPLTGRARAQLDKILQESGRRDIRAARAMQLRNLPEAATLLSRIKDKHLLAYITSDHCPFGCKTLNDCVHVKSHFRSTFNSKRIVPTHLFWKLRLGWNFPVSDSMLKRGPRCSLESCALGVKCTNGHTRISHRACINPLHYVPVRSTTLLPPLVDVLRALGWLDSPQLQPSLRRLGWNGAGFAPDATGARSVPDFEELCAQIKQLSAANLPPAPGQLEAEAAVGPIALHTEVVDVSSSGDAPATDAAAAADADLEQEGIERALNTASINADDGQPASADGAFGVRLEAHPSHAPRTAKARSRATARSNRFHGDDNNPLMAHFAPGSGRAGRSPLGSAALSRSGAGAGDDAGAATSRRPRRKAAQVALARALRAQSPDDDEDMFGPEETPETSKPASKSKSANKAAAAAASSPAASNLQAPSYPSPVPSSSLSSFPATPAKPDYAACLLPLAKTRRLPPPGTTTGGGGPYDLGISPSPSSLEASSFSSDPAAIPRLPSSSGSSATSSGSSTTAPAPAPAPAALRPASSSATLPAGKTIGHGPFELPYTCTVSDVMPNTNSAQLLPTPLQFCVGDILQDSAGSASPWQAAPVVPDVADSLAPPPATRATAAAAAAAAADSSIPEEEFELFSTDQLSQWLAMASAPNTLYHAGAAC